MKTFLVRKTKSSMKFKIAVMLIAFMVISLIPVGTLQAASTAPIVLACNPQSVGSDSAILYGEINSCGGETITDYGFFWGTDCKNLKKVSAGSTVGSGKFSCKINGLNSRTEYFFYPYAINSKGKGAGEIRSFITLGYTGTADYTTFDNITVYRHGFTKTAQQLIEQGRVYFTNADGILYWKGYDKSTNKINNVYIAIPEKCSVKFLPNCVYIAGDPYNSLEKYKLYQNTPYTDELYSILPTWLSWCERKIEEQKLIYSAAEYQNRSGKITAYARKSIQAKASARQALIANAEKGKVTQEFINFAFFKFVAQRQYNNPQSKWVVKDIQKKLKYLGYGYLREDGLYEYDTWNQVVIFQMANNLDVTGQVDSKTYNLIEEKYKKKAKK
ncbi:MAG: peptidoglycan-binding domain-containing protein [Ignavibacteriales bacterium]